MDRPNGQGAEQLLEPPLFDDPDALGEGAGTTCPECLIPLDEVEPDDAHCPWCGARLPEPLQALTWAQLEALEQAWPEALGA